MEIELASRAIRASSHMPKTLDGLGAVLWKNRLTFREWLGYRAFMFRRRKCKVLREINSLGFEMGQELDEFADDLDLFLTPCTGPSIKDPKLRRLADQLATGARSCEKMALLIESSLDDRLGREIGSGIAEILRRCSDELKSLGQSLAGNPRWIDVAFAASRIKRVRDTYRASMKQLEHTLALYNVLNESSRKHSRPGNEA